MSGVLAFPDGSNTMELMALERKTRKDAQSVCDFLSSENIVLGFYLCSDKVVADRAKILAR